MTYTFKPLPEILWGIFVSIVVALAMELVVFDEAVFLSDPLAWIAVVIGGAARAVGGFLVSALTSSG